MAKRYFQEVRTSAPIEIMGHVFNGLDGIYQSIEISVNNRSFGKPVRKTPKVEIPGIHILEFYKLYPCFDSYDYANEDRFYKNFFFSSKPFTDEEVELLKNTRHTPGICMVNEYTPEWAFPAIYYRGEGSYMTLATLESSEKKDETTMEDTIEARIKEDSIQGMAKVAPKDIGKLDMVIAFDTTGSMSAYIEAVREEVSEIIPRLFKDNDDLRLGIVAFGDYCDMENAREFGDAYQCILPTDNENDLIKFVKESKNTSGGDGDEFYELVIKRIVEETPWRKGSTRSILLIADASPHPLGYTYRDYVVGNQIDWRNEARKAADEKIKIDTVTITNNEWFKQLSSMTNGVSVPFHSGHKTAVLVEAAISSRGTLKSRMRFDTLRTKYAHDDEMSGVFDSYQSERDNIEGLD